jgi:deazaflavin-dependent oxidoreductase (nitroreductase family)
MMHAVTPEQIQALRGETGKQYTAAQWDAVNAEQINQFRANQGNLVDGLMAGLPTLLLTTRGARTGATRLNPLTYTRDGDRYVVMASKLGAAQHPSWYHNLLADPDVTLEVGTESFAATASVADETERVRLYEAHTLRFPNYAEYQSNTTRVIPVVIFTRVP